MTNIFKSVLAAASLFCTAAAATPDISGPWIISQPQHALTQLDGSPAPLLPGKTRATKDDPAQRCLPPGVPRLMMQNFPFNIVQGSTMYAMIFEWNHLNRIIHLIPAHTDTIGPMYEGQSIGHWDGDTLVVDSNSFNDIFWLDDTGLPHSDQLHTIEKIKLADGGKQLVDEITIDDPQTYSKNWTAKLVFKKSAGTQITEDYCLGRMNLNKLQVK